MKIRSTGTAAVMLALCACGGRGGALPPASPRAVLPSATKAPVKGAASATLSVTIPHPSASSKTRRPAYVSPSSAQLLVSVNGGASTTYALTANAPGCSVVQGNNVCTFQIAAKAGTDSFKLTLEDASGNVLSTNVVSATLAAAVATPVNVTLDGIPAVVQIVPGSGSTIEGTSSQYHIPGLLPQPIEAEALDADGNVIIGPGAPHIAAPTVTTGSSYATVVPEPGSTDPNAYLVESAGIKSGGKSVTLSATAQPIALNDGTQSPPVSGSTNYLFTPVIALSDGIVMVEYSVETQNAVAAFAVGTSGAGTLAEDAALDPTTGNLWILGFTPSGATALLYEYPYGSETPTLALGESNGVAPGAAGIAFDPSGDLYVANPASGFLRNHVQASIAIYTPSALTAASVTPSSKISPDANGDDLTAPVAIGVDQSKDIYVANGDGTIDLYPPGYAQTAQSGPPAMTVFTDPNGDLGAPTGMAVDPAGNVYVWDSLYQYVAYYPAGYIANGEAAEYTVSPPIFDNIGSPIWLDPSDNLYLPVEATSGAGRTEEVTGIPQGTATQTGNWPSAGTGVWIP